MAKKTKYVSIIDIRPISPVYESDGGNSGMTVQAFSVYSKYAPEGDKKPLEYSHSFVRIETVIFGLATSVDIPVPHESFLKTMETMFAAIRAQTDFNRAERELKRNGWPTLNPFNR